jgi:DNA-binding beta-propeller fold protein YncE
MKLGRIGDSSDRTDRSGVYMLSDSLDYKKKSDSLEHYAWRKSYTTAAFLNINRPKCVYGDNGHKLYVADGTTPVNAQIRQYELSIPYDPDSASYSGNNLPVQYVDTELGCSFSHDGTIMYLFGSSNVSSHHPPTTYDLSTPWDITTAVPRVKTLYTGAATPTATGVYVSPDGARLYLCGSSSDAVDQYDLSTAWDIGSASYVRRFSVSAQETVPSGVEFKPDGTRMYVCGSTGDDVNEYSLSTAWDISTASFIQAFSVSAQETVPTGVRFKPDGTRMYVCGSTGDDVNEYSLSTAWDVSTASYVQSFSFGGSGETTVEGVAFNSDGTKMYTCGLVNDGVIQYNLSTAWDISTATFANNTERLVESIHDVFVAGDDDYLFTISNYHNVAFRYTMKTAGSVSQLDGVMLATTTTEGYARIGFTQVSPDGTKFLACYGTPSYLVEYSLSTPFEIHTATLVNFVNLGPLSGEALIWNGSLSEDGKDFYFVGQ